VIRVGTTLVTLADRLLNATPRAWRRQKARRFYSQWLNPGALCFDIGANVGDRSRVFLALGARVVAAEPQPDCIGALRRLQHPRLTVEPVALGALAGTAELHIATATTISSMAPEWIRRVRASGRFGEHEWSSTIQVEVTTLDALIARYGRPALCKIDVEGYETEVIAGLSQPLPLISFEFVPEFAEGGRAAVRRLEGLGMTQFNFSRGESLRFEWNEWRSATELLSHLDDLSRDSRLWGDIYARPAGAPP
jgi:FkbM family methyltransferase